MQARAKLDTRTLTLIGLLVAVCAVCSQISIPLPFSPVPLTLQTLAIMITGFLLGDLYGVVAVAVYVLAGMIGLPVFAQGAAGLGIVLGPTGGFLWGFLPGAFLIGYYKDRLPIAKTWLRYSVVGIIGMVPVYLIGMLQLAFVAQMGVGAAFVAGVLPFLPLELVKILLAGRLVISLEKSGVLHR